MGWTFYNIDHPCTPSFPVGLVKTEADFIARSVVTDLGRWILVLAVTSVDVYLFFWLSHAWPVTWRTQEYVFSGCIVPPDSKKIKLRSSDQEASPWAVKNTGVVLVPCSSWKCVPATILGDVDFSQGPWVPLFMADEFSVRVRNIISKIGVLWTCLINLIFCYMGSWRNYLGSVGWQNSNNNPKFQGQHI